MMTKETFVIRGMHCASCAQTIEKALSKVAGVESAVVNFAAEKLTVEFHSQKTSPAKIKQAITSVGYDLGGDKPPAEIKHHEHGQEIKDLRDKTILGGVLSAVVLAGALTKQLSPEVQFVLTTPVLFWGGRQFFKGAFRELKNRRAGMDSLVVIGTSAAYFYSAFVTFFLTTTDIYFDTAAVIITLILLGRFLELRAKGQASEAIKKLMGLQPKEATVLVEEDDERIKQKS